MFLIIRILRNYRELVLFILLEIFALTLYYSSEGYGPEVCRNLRFQAHTLRFAMQSYFSLAETHAKLLAENTALRKQLYYSLSSSLHAKHRTQDTLIAAQVIHSTHLRLHNFLTLNKGYAHGLLENMGVIGPDGVVGKIRYVSNNYALAHSLLDVDLLTSARIQGVLCTVRWHGRHMQHAALEYLPRHVKVSVGDTIYTSGYDRAYPAHVPIATLKSFSVQENETFYKAEVTFLTDFLSLEYAYVMSLQKIPELDSLRNILDIQ